MVQYAENISAGGLFLRNASDLEPLSILEVTVVLPGFGEHSIKAKVAHIIGKEEADKIGLSPGAGLEIVNTDPAFQEALSRYLMILGKRKEKKVVVVEQTLCEQMKSAGYDALLYKDRDVDDAMAIVVPNESTPHKNSTTCKTIIGQDIDSVLAALDELLLQEQVLADA